MKLNILFPSLTCFLLLIGNFSALNAQGWAYHAPDYTMPDNLAHFTINATTHTKDGGMAAIIGNQFVKLDMDGQEQFRTTLNPILDSNAHKLIQTLDGGYAFLIGRFTGVDMTRITKLDGYGNHLWNYEAVGITSFLENKQEEIILIGGKNSHHIYRLTKHGVLTGPKQTINIHPNKVYGQALSFLLNPDSSSYTIVAGYKNAGSGGFPDSISVIQVDSFGNRLTDIDYSWVENNFYVNYISDVEVTNDNKIILAIMDTLDFDGTDARGARIVKMETNSSQVWSVLLNSSVDKITQLALGSNGDVFFSALGKSQINPFIIGKISSSGNLIWMTSFPSTTSTSFNFTSNNPSIGVDDSGNSYFGSGRFIFFNYQTTMIKLDSLGTAWPALIKGIVRHDQNTNCILDPLETELSNMGIIANGQIPGITFSNSSGEYHINVDTGTYQMNVFPPNSPFAVCNAQTVNLGYRDTAIVDILVKPLMQCPIMNVDVSTPFLRFCGHPIYSVNYCNLGTIPATNSYVEVKLDPLLSFISSTIPYTQINGNTYSFDLGTVDLLECNSFEIKTLLSCNAVLGQTHCVEAHIFPDSLCFPPDTIWDGSITELRAACVQDTVQFEIKNIGTGDMAVPQNFVVAEDDIIRTTNTYKLDSGDSLKLYYPANGTTFRLQANASPGYFPSNFTPTIAIEGCGFDSLTNTYSTGFVTQFHEADAVSYLSIDCQENIGPFDPNDKRAEPKGFGANHYIEQNTDIEYHIRFQNVGTDTAFNVMIRDTLSPHLDIMTLQPGASSHPYDFSIVNNNTMKFSFNDIELVDSTTNEPGSHGFVKFRISQLPNLPLGTIINNSAAIYFDFNEPIITNTTFHEIGDNFIEIILDNEEVTSYPDAQVIVYPNPFAETTTIDMVGGPIGLKTFSIYDALGRTVHKNQFEHSYQFNRNDLTTGVYFFSIHYKGNIIRQGKLVVQ